MRALINQIPAASILFSGPDFVLEMVNEEALRLLGRDKSILGKKLLDAIPEIKDQPFVNILNSVYTTGLSHEDKESIVHINRNGRLEKVFVNFNFRGIRDDSGEIRSVLCIGHDLTEQVNARALITEAGERYRLAIEASNLGTFDVDIATGSTVCSDRFVEIFGFDRNTIPKEKFNSVIHPDDREIRFRALEEGMKSGFLKYKVRHFLPDSSMRRAEIQGKIMYNDQGNPYRMLGTAKDITEEYNISLALKEQEAASGQKFRNTVMQADVGILIMRGPLFNVEMANKAYLQLVDRREDEFVGKNLFDALPEVRESIESLLRNVVDTGIPFHGNEFEVPLFRSGKQEMAYFNFVYQPLREMDGRIDGVIVVANEVTEQVKAKHALEVSRQEFQNTIMRSPIAMTIFRGPEWIIESPNETMLNEIWRKKPEEVIGKKALEVFPELVDQQFPQRLREVAESGVSYREDEALAYVKTGDGMKKYYLDFEYAPLKDMVGKVSGIFITVNNVTEKVESRRQINDDAERLKLATEGTLISTWDLNLETREIIHSPRLAEIFGHSRSKSLLHAEMRAQIHPEDLHSIVEKAFDEALRSGTYWYEARIVLPDESIRWIRTHGTVIFEGDHKPVRMLGTLMDITEQQEIEEKIAKLAAIVQTSDDAIISKRLDGTITSWNNSAERIFGYTAKEMIGTPIMRLIPEDRLGEEPAIIERLKRGERVDHFETLRLTKDKRLIDVSLTMSPIKDGRGNVIGASKIARDITEQKESLRRIKDSEQRLQIIIDASGLGNWELNVQTGEVTYSERYLEIMGYSPEDKPTHAELVARLHPDDLPGRKEAFTDAFANGYLQYQSRLIIPGVGIRWMEGKGKVFYDHENKPLKLVGTIRDFTQEKLISQQIEESESRLRIAALSSELGTWDYDPATQVLRWDNASRELFGVDADTAVTVDLFFGIMHPDDRETALAKMMRALDPGIGENYDTEYRLVLPGDTTRWIHAKGKAFFDDQGNPYLFAGTVLDITEKRIALEELMESERKFRLLADSMPQFIWTGDENGNLNYFNQSVYNYSGLTAEDLTTEGWLQIVHPDEREKNISRWVESVTTGKPFWFQHRFRRYDGEYRWQLSRAVPKKDAEGNIQGWIGTSTDVHDQKLFTDELETKVEQRTAELKRSNEELLKSNTELAQFAYVASHDLQEPLRKIQAFSARIRELEGEKLSEKGKDYFQRMHSASTRMQQLILDLLSYSKSNTSENLVELTDLNVLLQTVKEHLRESIDQKSATIISDELPVINVVPFQFEQLLTNIISNALKFSKADVLPVIKLKTEICSGQDAGMPGMETAAQYYHISISDNGIGFDQQFSERIFQVFQRLHGKEEYAGTGIGLAIVKKIIENHHGFISASSRQGQGATFDIYLPLR